MPPRIKTTGVGSYPVPSWMVGNTSRLVLRDAVMTVLKTQELAGLDLVTDGELMRFDPSHPETNGMVDYFASQMEGIRKEFTLSDFDRFRADRAPGFRLLTAGMAEAVEIRKGEFLANALHLRSEIIHHPVRLWMARVKAHEFPVGDKVQPGKFLRFQDRHDRVAEDQARGVPDHPGRDGIAADPCSFDPWRHWTLLLPGRHRLRLSAIQI